MRIVGRKVKQLTLKGDTILPSETKEEKIRCIITGKLRKATPEEKVRQRIARELIEVYGYPREDIEVEFPIKVGSKKPKRADIVIFLHDTPHKQENAYIIIETKRKDISRKEHDDALDQLKSYLSASLNAEFGILVVGDNKEIIKKISREGVFYFIHIDNIPKHFSEDENVSPKSLRDLEPAYNLKQLLRDIHNYIAANQGIHKDQAFQELTKLLFVKMYDEEHNDPPQVVIKPSDTPERVKQRVLKLFRKVQNEYPYIFKYRRDSIVLNPEVVYYAVKKLQNYALSKTLIDIKGEAYEELVGANLRGDRGEFFTPRNVCKMTVDMILSLFNEDDISNGNIKILDPAVGTGGFLIEAIEHIKQKLSKLEKEKLKNKIKSIAQNSLFGIDFNPLLVGTAQMNMVFHGDGSTNIVHADSLRHPATWSDKVLSVIFQDKIEEYKEIFGSENETKILLEL